MLNPKAVLSPIELMSRSLESIHTTHTSFVQTHNLLLLQFDIFMRS